MRKYRGKGTKEKIKKTSHPLRVIAIALFFFIVIVYYVTRLVNIQITGRDKYTTYSVPTYKRTVTIRAQRGEIFDRNGNPLVTNEYTYELYFDYGSFISTKDNPNETILNVISAIKETGNADKQKQIESPFIGEYPVLEYSDKCTSDKAFAKKFKSTLKTLELPEDISAKELAEYYVSRYDLRVEDSEGDYLFSNKEITELIKVRFDMDFSKFSTAEPYVFATDVDISLITYLKEHEIRGVAFLESVTRNYEYPGYASHILGRVGQIYAEDLEYYSEKGYKMNAIVGTSGCEEAFEDYLHGTDGSMLIVEDLYGNIIDQKTLKEPVGGCDVWLTIDIGMQIAAEDALRDNIKYIIDKAHSREGALDGEDASAGAITAIGAKDGAVYAMASYPTYDLSQFSETYASMLEDETKPLLNRALYGLYQPGSTFKVGVAVAALEEGIITPRTTITDKGRYTYYDDNGPRCWIYLQRGRTHGTINVIEAIQESCNYFFYDVGRQLTIEKMNNYCNLYGLGQPTGIELSEYVGVLAGPDYRAEYGYGEWYPGDTLQAAIGQSDNLFTPTQISSYIAALVNGGTRNSIHLLDSVRKFYTNELVYEYETDTLSHIEMSESTYKTILQAMKNVTENGSAASVFRNYPITIGGKTGTAQVSKTKSDNAIFTAFAPYDDPQIVCTAVIEQGNSGTDAGRSIKTVFDYYFKLGDYKVEDEGAN